MLPIIVLYGFLLTGVCPDCHAEAMPGYEEDLSAHRTLFVAPIETYEPLHLPKHRSKRNTSFTIAHDITSQLQQLLLDLKAYNEMTTSIAGYTIQGYNGTNRQLAFQIKEQLSTYFNYLHTEVQYKQPNFTVQIGRFLDRLEAYRFYLPIKKFFPQAIIRPTWFPNKAGIFEAEKPIEPLDELLVDDTQAIDEATIPAEEVEEEVDDVAKEVDHVKEKVALEEES